MRAGAVELIECRPRFIQSTQLVTTVKMVRVKRQAALHELGCVVIVGLL